MRKIMKSEWTVQLVMYFLIMSAMVTLNSCGGGGSGNNTNADTTAASGTVGTGGGTVAVSAPTSTIAGAKVVIPAGALPSNTNITISEVSNPPVFSMTATNNKVIDFGPNGTQFSQPVSVTIPYDPTNVVDKNNLRVYSYNEQDKYWEEEILVNNDMTNNLITATASHFSNKTAQEKPPSLYNITYYKASDGNLAATVTLKTPFDTYGSYIGTTLLELSCRGYQWAHDLLFKYPGYISFVYSVKLMEKGLIWDSELETQYIEYKQLVQNALGGNYKVAVSKTGTDGWFSSGSPYASANLWDKVVNWYSGYPAAIKFSHAPASGKQYYVKVTLWVNDSQCYDRALPEDSDRDNAISSLSALSALSTIDSDENGILNAYDAQPTISGTVTSGGTGLSGVTLTVPGAGSGTATTDSSGNYTITGVANGSYTVTPSKSGYTFAPSSTSVTVSGANQTGKNFTATASSITYSISGSVTSGGVGLFGVTLTVPGAGSGTATTNSSGNYTLSGVANGTYTITPTYFSGYTFSPSSMSVTVSGADVTGKSFTTISTYSISGTVTSGGVGLSGVTLTVPGAGSGSATTDSSGNYTLPGVANGTYTVTPSKTGYSFSPTSSSVTVSGTNQTGKNFTATQAGAYIIGGWVVINGNPLPGATVILTGGSYSAQVTTDANGYFDFFNVADGTYTLTAQKAGYVISPASISVTPSNALADINNGFTATPVAQTYSITGTIVDNNGAPLVSVAVALSGAGTENTTTNAGGSYTFPALANGSYTITPALANYTFEPVSLSATVSGADVSGKNFTATGSGSVLIHF